MYKVLLDNNNDKKQDLNQNKDLSDALSRLSKISGKTHKLGDSFYLQHGHAISIDV